MTRDEVLLIKTFDSTTTPFVPPFHSSFDGGGAGAPRCSCEAKLLVVLPQEDHSSHEQAKL